MLPLADEAWRVRLAHAYVRLRADVLRQSAAQDPVSPRTLRIMARTLKTLHDEIQEDPIGFERILVELGLSSDRGDIPN
jgi:hypothetical protein